VPTLGLVTPPHDWSVLGSGVLLGMWMLANFDSAINYIEEARIPVRTVQRSLLAVLSSAFLVYMIAAIGWQRAVPLDLLAKITENGDGGPIAAVAKEYLPPALTWIALFVVVTSATAGLQVSMTAAARTAYRMAQEGHLPSLFGRTNRHRAPWVSVVAIACMAVFFVWYKPLAEVNFYYNAVVVTLALSYMSALAAFTRLMFARQPAHRRRYAAQVAVTGRRFSVWCAVAVAGGRRRGECRQRRLRLGGRRRGNGHGADFVDDRDRCTGRHRLSFAHDEFANRSADR